MFLSDLGISLEAINEEKSALDRLAKQREALDIIYQKDDDKDKFRIITNTMLNLYEESKPEIFEKSWSNYKFGILK